MPVINSHRRTLWRTFTWLNLPPIGDLARGNVIITHASGESDDPDGGVVNNQIATDVEAVQIYRRERGLSELPVLAQGEAALVMMRRGINVTRRSMTQAEHKAADPEGYIQSKHMAWWHRDVCMENGWDRPILISHQFHLVRAYWVTLKQCDYFNELIVPKIGKFIPDKKNKQKRWRFLATAYSWEMAARAEHLARGII